MVAEYSKLNEELAAGAKAGGLPGARPAARSPEDTRPSFVNTPVGSSFDKKYMAEMVSEHREAARLYQQESERGRVTSLEGTGLETAADGATACRAWPAETAGQVGVEVTTTTAEARQGSDLPLTLGETLFLSESPATT